MSALFNGTTTGIQWSNDNPSAVGFTWMAWLFPLSMGEGNVGVIYHSESTPTFRFDGTAGSNKLRYSWYYTGTDADYRTAAPGIPLNVWSHIALSVIGTPITPPVWYVNGAAVALQTVATPSGSPERSLSPVYTGTDSAAGGSCFNGRIAEQAIWDGFILTAKEVAAAYLNGPLGAGPMPTHLYAPFDQILGGSGGLTRDYSPAARTVTLVGGGPAAAENPPCRPAMRRG